MSDLHGWIVIDLHAERHWGDCPMCEEYRLKNRAVGWYCGPVKLDPGEPVPEWGPDAVAGGMCVCQPCHDKFYGI